jgi:hypothetical protein
MPDAAAAAAAAAVVVVVVVVIESGEPLDRCSTKAKPWRDPE